MIYFVRHGQTNWNLEGRIQGQTDISLNETGFMQAKEIKRKLENIKFEKVFCSPLKRALETAKVIYDGKIIIDDRIKERNNGELEGKLKSEIKKMPDFNNPDSSECNIEPIKVFNERIKLFLDEITRKYKNKNILVVTHAGVCIYVKCYFEGEPTENNFESYKLKNGEILSYNI